MKIKAEMGHWSSVVGISVLLIDADSGRMIGQVAFMCHDDSLRSKEVQEHLSKLVCAAINEEGEA